MPGKKTREQKSERTGRTAGDAGRKKDKPVTQSTRFTAQQMQEIEQACKAKGWSISQLMLTATVEKAMAINQIAANYPTIVRMMRRAAELLMGSPPAVSYQGQRIDPSADGWREWVEEPNRREFGIYWRFLNLDDSDSGYAEPINSTVVEYDLERDALAVVEPDERGIPLGGERQADGAIAMPVRKKELEVIAESMPVKDRQIFRDCLRAVAPDLAPIFCQAEEEARHTLWPYEGKPVTFRKADDLLRKEAGDAAAK